MTVGRLVELPPALAAARPAVTVGVFDGVHLGHQALVAELVRWARAAGAPAVVVVVDPHPRAVLLGEGPPRLTSVAQRRRLLEGLGVDAVAVLRFDAAVAAWSPDDYARRVLRDALGAAHVLVGANHRFGRDRQGDLVRLAALGAELGFEPRSLALASPPGTPAPASSTAIRAAVAAGDLAVAAGLLGRAHALEGAVEAGDRRGRTLGFPTANVGGLDGACLPPRGVYAVRARVHGPEGAGPALPAVANLGRRPTFDAAGGAGPPRDLLEVHLLEGGRDLYGATLEVQLVARLREERRFTGPDALRAQIAQDCAAAAAALGVVPAGS